MLSITLKCYHAFISVFKPFSLAFFTSLHFSIDFCRQLIFFGFFDLDAFLKGLDFIILYLVAFICFVSRDKNFLHELLFLFCKISDSIFHLNFILFSLLNGFLSISNRALDSSSFLSRLLRYSWADPGWWNSNLAWWSDLNVLVAFQHGQFIVQA